MSEIHNIFKTPVYNTHLENIDNKALAKQCLDFSKKDKGTGIKEKNKWQMH